MSSIKVMIIDDNSTIRKIVKELIKMEKDLTFCGEAEDSQAAWVLLSEAEPDVAVIDISLNEEGGGLKILQDIKSAGLTTKVIMFSAHSESLYADQCLKAGAHGYLSKDKTVGQLVDAIRSVYAGEQFVPKI